MLVEWLTSVQISYDETRLGLLWTAMIAMTVIQKSINGVTNKVLPLGPLGGIACCCWEESAGGLGGGGGGGGSDDDGLPPFSSLSRPPLQVRRRPSSGLILPPRRPGAPVPSPPARILPRGMNWVGDGGVAFPGRRRRWRGTKWLDCVGLCMCEPQSSSSSLASERSPGDPAHQARGGPVPLLRLFVRRRRAFVRLVALEERVDERLVLLLAPRRSRATRLAPRDLRTNTARILPLDDRRFFPPGPRRVRIRRPHRAARRRMPASARRPPRRIRRPRLRAAPAGTTGSNVTAVRFGSLGLSCCEGRRGDVGEEPHPSNFLRPPRLAFFPAARRASRVGPAALSASAPLFALGRADLTRCAPERLCPEVRRREPRRGDERVHVPRTLTLGAGLPSAAGLTPLSRSSLRQPHQQRRDVCARPSGPPMPPRRLGGSTSTTSRTPVAECEEGGREAREAGGEARTRRRRGVGGGHPPRRGR